MSTGACSGAGGSCVPGLLRCCVRCGGSFGPGVIVSRRHCDCAAPPIGVVGRCKARGSRRQVIDGVHDSSFACHFQPCMSPIDRHCFVSDALHRRCTAHAAPGARIHAGLYMAIHVGLCRVIQVELVHDIQVVRVRTGIRV